MFLTLDAVQWSFIKVYGVSDGSCYCCNNFQRCGFIQASQGYRGQRHIRYSRESLSPLYRTVKIADFLHRELCEAQKIGARWQSSAYSIEYVSFTRYSKTVSTEYHRAAKEAAMSNYSQLIKKVVCCLAVIILSAICFSVIDINISLGYGENICQALRLIAKAIILGADLICVCIIAVRK